METQKEKSLDNQKLINIVMIAVVVIVLSGLAILYFSQCSDGKCPSAEAFVRSFGPWAPALFVVIYISASPIPFLATFLSAASGLVFGALWGTVLAVFSATISSLVPFTLARRLGREWVASKLKGKKIENLYQKSEGQGGFLFIMFMRMVPIIPWEIQNYIAGLSKVNLVTFIPATIIGIIPGTFSLVFLGSAVKDPGSWQFWLGIGLTVGVMVIPVIISVLQNKNKKKAEETQE